MAFRKKIIWSRVLSSRVVNDRCLVNCGTWESFSGDLRNGHLVISAEGCHKRKDICFNWELTVSFQWSYIFQLCIRPDSFLSNIHFLLLIFQTWCWFCCCYSCYQGVHWITFRFNCIWMKYHWPVVTRAVTVFRSYFQVYHLGLQLYTLYIINIRWTKFVKKENRQPGSRRGIRARIYSFRSIITQQLPKNYSWRLASIGTELWKYVDWFALLAFFSALSLVAK